MNKTRKLTQGAMLLAIVGALMAIDRQIGFWFSFLISMMFAVIIVIYSSMYEIKDGIVIAIALGVLTFLLGDPEITYIYYPISAITGLAYSYGLKKDWNKRKLLVISIITFVLGEILVAMVINPILFNLPIKEQVESLKTIFEEAFSGYANDPNMGAMLNETLQYFYTLLPVMFVAAIIISGIAEGVLVHLMSILLLKKFRIKDIPIKGTLNSKPNKAISYASMILLLVFVLFGEKIKAYESLMYVGIILSMFAEGFLLWNGYLYVCLYGRVVLHKNLSFVVIIASLLLSQIAIPALTIIGFLYGAGPLYDKLMEKKAENEKNNII